MRAASKRGALFPRLASFSDGAYADLLAVGVRPRSRKLVSYEFVEMGRETASPEMVNDYEWPVRVPTGCAPFVASSGFRIGALRQVWCGWVESAAELVGAAGRAQKPGAASLRSAAATKLAGVSLYTPSPLEVVLEPADRLAPPALVTGDRAMVHYLWRPKGGGYGLFRLAFHGGEHEAPRVASEDRGLADADPVLSIATAVPGSDAVLVSWVQSDDGQWRIRIARDSQDSAILLASVPLGPWRPLPVQRLGAFADREGCARVRLVAEHASTGAYAVVTAATPGESEAAHILPLTCERGSLCAAASFYYRNAYQALPFVLALDRDGALRRIEPGGGTRVVRGGLPADYDFPIAVSVSRAYEATLAQTGELALHALS